MSQPEVRTFSADGPEPPEDVVLLREKRPGGDPPGEAMFLRRDRDGWRWCWWPADPDLTSLASEWERAAGPAVGPLQEVRDSPAPERPAERPPTSVQELDTIISEALMEYAAERGPYRVGRDSPVNIWRGYRGGC